MLAHSYGIGIFLLETRPIALEEDLPSDEFTYLTRPIALAEGPLPHCPYPLGAKHYFPNYTSLGLNCIYMCEGVLYPSFNTIHKIAHRFIKVRMYFQL